MPEIRVNSKLDNSEFVMGSREMINAIKSLQSAISGVDKGLRDSLSGYSSTVRQNVAASRDFYGELKTLEAEANKLRASISGVKDESVVFAIAKRNVANAEKTVAKYTERLEALKAKQLAGVHDSKEDEALRKSIASTEAALQRAQEKLSGYQAKRDEMLSSGKAYKAVDISKAESQIKALEERIANMRTPALKDGIDKAKASLAEYMRLYEEYTRKQGALGGRSEAEASRAAYDAKVTERDNFISENEKIIEALEKRKAEVEELRELQSLLDDTQGVAEQDAELEGINAQLQAYRDTVSQYSSELSALWQNVQHAEQEAAQSGEYEGILSGLREEIDAVKLDISDMVHALKMAQVDEITVPVTSQTDQVDEVVDKAQDAVDAVHDLETAKQDAAQQPIVDESASGDVEAVREVENAVQDVVEEKERAAEQPIIDSEIQIDDSAISEVEAEYQALLDAAAAASNDAFEDAGSCLNADDVEVVEDAADAFRDLAEAKKESAGYKYTDEEAAKYKELTQAAREDMSEAEKNALLKAGISGFGDNFSGKDVIHEASEGELAKIAEIEAKVNDTTNAYREQTEAVNETKGAVDDLNSAAKPADKNFQPKIELVSREEYEEQLALIEKAKAALEGLQAKQDKMQALGVSKDSKQYQSNEYDIEQKKEEIQELSNELKLMKIDPDASKLDEVSNKANNANAAVTRLGSGIGHVAASLAKMAANGAWRFLQSLASTAANAAVQLAKLAASAVASALEKIAIAAKNTAVALARFAGGAITSGLHALGNAARSAAARVAEIGGSAAKSALSGLGSLVVRGTKSLLGLNKSLSQTKKGFARGLKTILKYAFGVRSLYFLFRKIRTAIKEGLGELAKKDPQLKTSIDNIKKSFNGLKGSLASAFSPIVTAVEPALVSLINLLTKAINTLGAFFAALTGKSVYYKSVGALDATGKSAKNASNSVKDLKKQLASFDDLDILKENDSSGSGNSGGYSFEETPIESDILDFVGRLKKMFEEGAWDELGHLIADGINSAIKKVQNWVKWENIGPTITKIMEGITGTINGIVDGVDWNNIGATLGDGFNTVVNTLELWWSGIDWENLGVQFGNGINSLIDRVDWDNLGNMLREKAEAFVGVIKGAVTTIKWGNAGRDLGIVLNRFFKDPEGKIWKDAGDTIDRTIKGMLDFGKKFLIEFEPEVVAEDIKTALGQIDWDDIANKLWEDAKLAFKAAGTFVTVLLGGGKKNLFGQTVVSDDWWNDLADELSKGFNSAIEKLTDFIKNFPVDKVVLELAAFFVRVKNGVRFDRLGTMLASGMNTALSAIGTAISAFEADAETLGGQLADAANAMVKEANLDGDDDGSLKTTITKAFKGAIHFVDAFMERFDEENLAGKIRSTLTGIPWSSIASDVWSTIRTIFQKAGNFVTVLLGGKLPKVDVDLPYGAWKTEQLTKQAKGMDTSEITNALSKALTGAINDAVGKLDEFISGMNIKDTVDAFTGFFTKVINGISWRDLGSLFGTLIQKALDLLGGLMKWWATESAKLGQNIGDFFNSAITYKVKWTGDNSVASFIEDGLRGAIQFIKGFFDTFDAVAFGNGLRAALADVDWKGIAQEIWDTLALALSKLVDFTTVLLGGEVARTGVKDDTNMNYGQWKNNQELKKQNGVSSMSEKLMNLVNAITDAIVEAFNNIPWATFGDRIRTWLVEEVEWIDIAKGIIQVLASASDALQRLLLGVLVGDELANKIVDLKAGGRDKLVNGAFGFLENNKDTGLFKALSNPAGYISKLLGWNSDKSENGKIQKGFNDFVGNVVLGGKEATWSNFFEDALDGVQLLTAPLTRLLGKASDIGATADAEDSGAWEFAQQYAAAANRNTEALLQNTRVSVAQTKQVKKLTPAKTTRTLFGSKSAKLAYETGANRAGTTISKMKEQSIDLPVNFLPAGATTYLNNLSGYMKSIFAPGYDTDARVHPQRSGFTTIAQWITGNYMGGAVEKGIGAARSGFTTIAQWLLSNYMGGEVNQSVGVKQGWYGTPQQALGLLGLTSDVSVDAVGAWGYWGILSYLGLANLDTEAWVDADTPWWARGKSVLAWLGLLNLTATVNFVAGGLQKLGQSVGDAIAAAVGRTNRRASGGYFRNGSWHSIPQYASGGVIMSNGRSSWFDSVRKYAKGTRNVHGSLFVAGEAGPEVVGHVGGRTEVLNKSQLASTMYSAVTNGMLAALSHIRFEMPSMATGSVLPYDIAAQIARTGEEIQNRMDANNEDLIQTMISCFTAQTSAIVAALQAVERSAGKSTLNTRQIINDINRNAQMFGVSPIKG